jgi:N-acetylglutamate synthase-like GNAT family acetyltransferase
LLTQFNIAATGFTVRPARPLDEKACRMLLPELAAVDAHRFVAVERGEGLVIGAAGLTYSQRTQPLVGSGVALHVIPPCRRHGVARALLNTLESLARTQGARALYSAQRVQFDSDSMQGWKRLGFDVFETIEEHELPLAPVLARLAPLVEQARNRGHIPADAQVIPLYAANRPKVLQLHLDHLGGDRATLYQRLLGHGAGAFHPCYSRVLTVGDRVAGCLLAHRHSQYAAMLDANIIAPEYRAGWANALLRLEAIEGAAALGITHFHFTTFDKYADTRAFAANLGATTTRRHALMWRKLE